jgi:hypothetical protein
MILILYQVGGRRPLAPRQGYSSLKARIIKRYRRPVLLNGSLVNVGGAMKSQYLQLNKACVSIVLPTMKGAAFDTNDRQSWQPASNRAQSSTAPSQKGKYTDSDVLTGRDGMALSHPGNKFFRTLVNMHRPAYQSAKKRHTKTDIINAIISTVWESGGRFLTLEASADPLGQAVGAEMESYEIHQMVSHALRAGKNRRGGPGTKTGPTKSSGSDATAEKTAPGSSAASSRSPSSAPSPNTTGIDKELAAAVAGIGTAPIGQSTSLDAELASQAMISLASGHDDLSSQGLLLLSHDALVEGWTTDRWRQLVAHEMHRRSLVRAAPARNALPVAPPVLVAAAGAWPRTHPASIQARSCPELRRGTSILVTESAMSTERRHDRGSRLSLPLLPSHPTCSRAAPVGEGHGPDIPPPQPRYERCSSAPASIQRLLDTDSYYDETEDQELEVDPEVNDTEGGSPVISLPHVAAAVAAAAAAADAATPRDAGDAESSNSASSHSFFTLDGKRAEF